MPTTNKIGIVAWKTGENSFGVTTPYLHYFSKFGQVEMIMPHKEVRQDLNLVVLPGGMDMNPTSYGEMPGFMTGNTDVFKQAFVDHNLNDYIQAKVPVFGICLGLQQLAVFFGGKLKQHFVSTYSGARGEEVEDLTYYQEGVKYFNLENKEMKKVNSLHHQAVMVHDMPKGFSILATSKSWGNVEAFYSSEFNAAAVQWHPEELSKDAVSAKIITKLLTK